MGDAEAEPGGYLLPMAMRFARSARLALFCSARGGQAHPGVTHGQRAGWRAKMRSGIQVSKPSLNLRVFW